MKKMILMLLALVLAAAALTVFAQEEPVMPQDEAPVIENVLFTGFVIETADESILVHDPNGMTVQVNLTDETLYDGKEPVVGDFVHITYNGMLARSTPPQLTAQHIGCYALMGVVSEMTEEGFLLTLGDEVHQVNADAALLASIQDGMFVTVYHSGMMTRSIPAQVSAAHIRGQEIVGTVTEMVEGGFTLTVDGEELPYHVALKEDVMLFVQAEPGMEVIVITDGLMTASLESVLVNATEVLALPVLPESFDMAGTVTEIGEGFILIQSADGQEIQVNTYEETLFEGKEIAAGDFIHVTYGGQMTFSLPPQIAAQKIGCYAHTGVVGEITEGQFALETETETILVNAAADMMDGVETGMTVTVYSNGAMTMSLPAQIGAEMITATETIED